MGSFKPVRVEEIRDSAEVERVLATLAEAGADAARAACPRNTGALATSIGVDSERGRAAFFYGLPYGVFVEFGTRYQPAQVFMRGPGMDAAKRAAQ